MVAVWMVMSLRSMRPGQWNLNMLKMQINLHQTNFQVFVLLVLLNCISSTHSDLVTDVEFITTVPELSMSSSHSSNGSVGSFVKCEERKELLTNYSEASSAFIKCAVFHAKPVVFCEKCVPEFHEAVKEWDKINHNTDCKEDILISDRLQIVSHTHSFLIGLWQDGACQNCYDESFRPKNSTTEFLLKFNATIECFMHNGGGPVIPDTNLTLCDNCHLTYQRLSRYYAHMADDQLCMDIIDMMNRTYMEWNENCPVPLKHYVVVVTLSAFVCILPLFFYLATWLHGNKRQQILVERSREGRMEQTASSRLFAGTMQTSQ